MFNYIITKLVFNVFYEINETFEYFTCDKNGSKWNIEMCGFTYMSKLGNWFVLLVNSLDNISADG